MTRILLVEDDDMLADGLRFALERESFQVDRASTVGESLIQFATRDYDLVLLDVMLPDGSGFEVCGKIRERSQVPVLFLTACDEEVSAVRGLEIGGDDYIAKPFRLKELVSRIKANLRRMESMRAQSERTGEQAPPLNTGHHESPVEKADSHTLLRSGSVEVSPLEARVWKNGIPMELTPVEFRLLLALIRHPNQILTRDRLLELLWDAQGEFVDDNTLSVNIRRLREKLEDQPSRPTHIITVRGLGYRWETPTSSGREGEAT